jgi:nitroimidazol reductase NimA-like FMN-containing flavoprotein (pyridoxamine 5'-phosphate oxidase superfamily)
MLMAEPRMRSAKKEIVDREELHRILDEAMVIRLGVLDGERPYVVPLNFARDGDDLWFHAAKAGHKLDCLRAAPAVCVEVDHFIGLRTGPRACDDWSSSYESVIGFGTAEIVEDPDAKQHGLRTLMRKYSGREDWEFPDASVSGTAVVRIRLESLTGKRSPAGG